MDKIKCIYCGKVYPSPSEAHKRSCRQHPKGCWKGCCKGEMGTEFLWSLNRKWEEEDKERAEINRQKNEENAAIMAKRPVFLIEKHSIWDQEYEDNCRKNELKIDDNNRKQVDVSLRELSFNLINKWDEPIAKNTVEDLIEGCQYAIVHETGDKGKLKTWEERLKELKRKVADKNFWKSIFWLMEVKLHSHYLRDLSNIDINNIVVGVLTDWDIKIDYTKKQDPDKGQNAAEHFSMKFLALKHVAKNNNGIDPSWEKFLEKMEKNVMTYDYWADLYCLIRINLHLQSYEKYYLASNHLDT